MCVKYSDDECVIIVSESCSRYEHIRRCARVCVMSVSETCSGDACKGM